jgi:cytochrome c oxidase subunit 1
MAMGLIGAFFAYVFRMQLAFPGAPVPGYGLVTPVDYNALVTNHGSIMIFWFAMPVLIAATWRSHASTVCHTRCSCSVSWC